MNPASLPVIAVASGKGGVGKTTVALALARGLVAAGRKIGLVDADLYGPDIPQMLGIRRDVPATSLTLTRWDGTRRGGLEAVEVDGLKVASAGFLLGGQQGLSIGAGFGEMLLARLIRHTDWGGVQALVVDLPPGTGDVQQSLLGLVGQVGALLVVTPAEVSHLDTGRALTVLKAARATVIGGVENMAYLQCPHCGEETLLHKPATPDRTIWAQGVRQLARLPYRPEGAPPAGEFAPVVDAALRYLDG